MTTNEATERLLSDIQHAEQIAEFKRVIKALNRAAAEASQRVADAVSDALKPGALGEHPAVVTGQGEYRREWPEKPKAVEVELCPRCLGHGTESLGVGYPFIGSPNAVPCKECRGTGRKPTATLADDMTKIRQRKVDLSVAIDAMADLSKQVADVIGALGRSLKYTTTSMYPHDLKYLERDYQAAIEAVRKVVSE